MLDRERFQAPELLFNPGLNGIENTVGGASDMVFKAINDSPIDNRKELYANIMISGGTSLFPGFSTRLDNDIRRLYLENNDVDNINVKINVIDPPRRKFSVFMGSCVFV